MNFHLHKDNAEHGPYDENQILAMLQEGLVNKKDIIYAEEVGAWKPIEEVFDVEEAISHQMDEGQDPNVVAEIFRQTTPLLSSHEQIFYIAHQKPKMLKQKPDSVVVTNERLIINRQGLGGTRLEDYQWKDIMSIQMRDGLMGTTFSLLDRNDHIIQVDDLPKPQLEKLCQLGQEMRADRAVS